MPRVQRSLAHAHRSDLRLRPIEQPRRQTALRRRIVGAVEVEGQFERCAHRLNLADAAWGDQALDSNGEGRGVTSIKTARMAKERTK